MQSVDSAASRMFNTAKIMHRFKELQKEVAEDRNSEILYTRQQAADDLKMIKELSLKDIKANGVRQANSSAFLTAAKELMELEGNKAETAARISKIKAETRKILADIDKEDAADDEIVIVENLAEMDRWLNGENS